MIRTSGCLRPSALFQGARVALVAPAGPVTDRRLFYAVDHCRALGLEPIQYPSASARDRYLAGPDDQRFRDLQSAFDDPSIDGIWALRGGYGTLRILDRLDLARQQADPKPFVGFSDNTTIHVRHAAFGVGSFHGPHPGTRMSAEAASWFTRVLFHADPPGTLPILEADPAPVSLVPGRAVAPLYGGNLSMLAAMCGGTPGLTAEGCILFLEDLAEPAYRVDRMLVQLSRSGVLDGVAGLAFGRFTNAPDDEVHPVAEAIREFATRVGVPAVLGLPFGHVEHNCVVPVGAEALLDADAASLSVLEPAVSAGG